MWQQYFTDFPIASTAGILLAGIVVGLVFEKIVLRRLNAIAESTEWKGDDAMLAAVRGFTTLWFVLVALYAITERANIADPTGEWVRQGIIVVIILSITAAIARLAASIVEQYLNHKASALPSTSILINITRLIIYTIGGLFILQWLGISITPILTALGVGGLAVALALQDTLSNLFSGIHIIASRHVKPGDYIQIESGEEGTVMDVTWRNTMLKNVSNHMIIVPNSKLAQAVVTNFNMKKKEVVSRMNVQVSYDGDLDVVEKLTLKVATDVLKKMDAKTSSEPTVYFKEFGESSITMLVIIRAQSSANRLAIQHQFIKELTKSFTEQGIEIPFPKRTIYTKKG